ncbi:hypothetical protein ACHAWF_013563 [Thalassiosira exigua]
MSRSAADYYKVSRLEASRLDAGDDLEEARDRLARAREVLARCEGRVAESEGKVASLDEAVADAKAGLEEAERASDAEEVVNPLTGLERDEKIELPRDDGQREYLFALHNARRFASEGDLEEAVAAERIARALANKCERRINSRAHFAGPETAQVPRHRFVDPRSIPDESDDAISATVGHAVNLFDEGILDDPERLARVMGEAASLSNPHHADDPLAHFYAFAGGHSDDDDDVPEGVNAIILIKVIEQIKDLKRCHDEMANANVNREEDQEGDGDDSDDDGSKAFTIDYSALTSIETAIKNLISAKKEELSRELEPPTSESSNIARYNPRSHFQFKSDEAKAGTSVLMDSLLNCKLRERPMDYLSFQGQDPKRGRMPFEFFSYQNDGFDLDGNLMAMCGDELHDELRESKNFIAFQDYPIPANLESSRTLGDLRDCSGSNEPWETHTGKSFKFRSEQTWFSSVVADERNGRVWAACSRTGRVLAFSTEDREGGEVARLQFPEPEVKLQRRFANGSFTLTKCGDTLVGAGSTGRLSAWNMNSAVESFCADSSPSEPHIVTVEDSKYFQCGDLQHASGSQILVAPVREYGNDRSSTLRLYDVNNESLVGLFCGTYEDVSIGKQYCVETHNVCFAMSGTVGCVFDIRTCQPSICVHVDESSSEQILGVPTGSNMPVAFTYGPSEDIKCWDLRMPGSHVYTMATGNTVVDHLFWHEGTSSLLASTHSKHILKYGRYGAGYSNGDRLDEDEMEEMRQTGHWPRRAVHDRSYFGAQWHVDSCALLQYPFKNGGKSTIEQGN